MYNPRHEGPQLYLLSRDNPGDPRLLPGQPLDRVIFDGAWSPNGRFIAFTSREKR